MTLAPKHYASKMAKKINGYRIGKGGDQDGYEVEVYRASTGRITIRCYFWHHTQDISREGYLLDSRVAGADLATAELRARDAGYPTRALMEAISEAEENEVESAGEEQLCD